MRITWVAMVVWVAAVVGTALQPSEKPTEAYQKAMKDVNAANTSLRADVTAKNYEAIAKDAATLKASFQVTLDFWTARKVEDATGVAQGALKASTDLEAAAKAKNDDGIATAARTIGGSCQSCHTAHRQRMPDGTYEIK